MHRYLSFFAEDTHSSIQRIDVMILHVISYPSFQALLTKRMYDTILCPQITNQMHPSPLLSVQKSNAYLSHHFIAQSLLSHCLFFTYVDMCSFSKMAR